MSGTVTGDLTSFLDTTSLNNVTPLEVDNESEDIYDSIYVQAANQKVPLVTYVTERPDEALFRAERSLAAWNDVLNEAILKGNISTHYANNVRVTKNTTDLIKIKIQTAVDELALVRKIRDTLTAGTKKDRLVSALYNRAVEGNDTRAMLYLIDRVDGKLTDKTATGASAIEEVNIFNIDKIVASLFDKQLQVLNAGENGNGCGRRIACCSRRAGKSHLAVAMITMACLAKPGTNCLYIGKTAKLAEGLFKGAFSKMVRLCGLKDSKGKPLDWRHFENGSSVMVRGLSNTGDPDMIRGFTFEIVVIDEFFHMESGLLDYLTKEVIEPSQLDYADTYKMLMIGTPPKSRDTYGEKVWREYDIPKFEWTWRDNPFIKNGEAFLERVAAEKHLPLDSIFMLREYGGQWVFESDLLLYPDYFTYDFTEGIPACNVTSISIGIDYGTTDNTAITAVAWDSTIDRGYVFFEKKFNLLSCPHGMASLPYLKQIIKQCWRISLDFWPTLNKREANKRIQWNADSTDKMLTQELARDIRMEEEPTMAIQIIDAHRTDQEMMKDKIRDLLRTASLLLPKNSDIALECELTAFKIDANGRPTRDIDHKKYHPDLLPALRYAMYRLVGHKQIGADIALVPSDAISYGGALDIDFETVDTLPLGFMHRKVG